MSTHSNIAACSRMKPGGWCEKRDKYISELLTTWPTHAAPRPEYVNRNSAHPHHTFADMISAIEQHSQGLVTVGELIIALQCTPIQLDAVADYVRIPYSAQRKISLSYWDEVVATKTERNDAP